uniref:Cytochrome c oxidase subunit 2 n=1 Tax=Rhinotergum shaoguanense TaxID=1452699 RepID=A0A1S5XVW1_9ACAR|nr:cytochrome c oxidase subunit II [Rhinotergum shaoguanense]AQQ72847.1 cytochrome oxidase subunit 2 [Rhinotergum shaoguanense]
MMTWNSFFFHSPSCYLMELVVVMHDYVMMILVSILLVVLMNMSYFFVCKSFNLEFFEEHGLETIWTITPFFLLLFIVIPSLSSLYMLDTCFFCGMTVSIMGHQWYWSYFYKDLNNLFFDSYMLPSDSSSIRLLEVDNRLVVPNHLPIRFLVSSADVVHSWTIPSFGVKMDAVPGRLNQFCFSSKRSGIFFGQCSEICGANHSFMPIVMESIPFKEFTKIFW